MLGKLLQLLPVLAVIGLTLNIVEDIPSALAHKAPRDHRHLAARKNLASNIGAREKRRSPAGSVIRRNADGSQCRVRQVSSSLTDSTTAIATSSSSDAAPSSTGVDSTSSSTASTAAWSSAASPSPSADDDSADSVSVTTSSDSASWTPSSSSSAAWTSPSAAASSGSISGSVSVSLASSGGSKFGLGWPNGNWADSGSADYVGNYIGSKSKWYYTWSPDNVGSADTLGLEFVPMLWGPNQVSDWWAQQSNWNSNVKSALFFNEPNEGSQCNVAASDAVSYWMNDFLPVRSSKGLALGGAATTSAPSGLQWIQDFSSACTNAGNSAADCKMDFVPIHYYYTDVDNFQNYVSNFHQKTGLDIWITEYACQDYNGGAQCSTSQVWNFHQSMSAWFDEQDYIVRYSPFGVMENMQGVNADNALMSSSGSITDLGSWVMDELFYEDGLLTGLNHSLSPLPLPSNELDLSLLPYFHATIRTVSSLPLAPVPLPTLRTSPAADVCHRKHPNWSNDPLPIPSPWEPRRPNDPVLHPVIPLSAPLLRTP
ncbi:hypothetical protein P7C73_g3703, partial [Tremellales sp. Uapishka_1]